MNLRTILTVSGLSAALALAPQRAEAQWVAADAAHDLVHNSQLVRVQGGGKHTYGFVDFTGKDGDLDSYFGQFQGHIAVGKGFGIGAEYESVSDATDVSRLQLGWSGTILGKLSLDMRVAPVQTAPGQQASIVTGYDFGKVRLSMWGDLNRVAGEYSTVGEVQATIPLGKGLSAILIGSKDPFSTPQYGALVGVELQLK